VSPRCFAPHPPTKIRHVFWNGRAIEFLVPDGLELSRNFGGRGLRGLSTAVPERLHRLDPVTVCYECNTAAGQKVRRCSAAIEVAQQGIKRHELAGRCEYRCPSSWRSGGGTESLTTAGTEFAWGSVQPSAGCPTNWLTSSRLRRGTRVLGLATRRPLQAVAAQNGALCPALPSEPRKFDERMIRRLREPQSAQLCRRSTRAPNVEHARRTNRSACPP
jgi:hypothetical protein